MKRTRQKKPRRTSNGRSISAILASLPDQFTGSSITIADLKDALSGRSYGILLLILALPNLIPLPTPGLSAALGAPLLLFTFQWMLGIDTPWFPRFIACKKLKLSTVERVCKRTAPYMKKLERFFKPRLQWMVEPPMTYLLAFTCVLLSLIMMLPVPFGNALPAFIITLVALALLAHDGLLALIALLLSAAGFYAMSQMIVSGIEAAQGWVENLT